MNPLSSTIYQNLLPEGFTPLPRRTLDSLLCLDLSKRELLILLLVARLTYGCRGQPWIALRQTDLQVVGIGANHARDCLESLLGRGLLVQNESRPEYRLGELVDGEDTPRRLQRLELLVVRQLINPSLQRNPSTKRKPAYPQLGSLPFQKAEPTLSIKGKKSDTSRWRFDRSASQFVRRVEGGEIQ